MIYELITSSLETFTHYPQFQSCNPCRTQYFMNDLQNIRILRTKYYNFRQICLLYLIAIISRCCLGVFFHYSFLLYYYCTLQHHYWVLQEEILVLYNWLIIIIIIQGQVEILCVDRKSFDGIGSKIYFNTDSNINKLVKSCINCRNYREERGNL